MGEENKPKQLALSFPPKSAEEVEAEHLQWVKSLPPGVGGFSRLGSRMRVAIPKEPPAREEPPVQEKPRQVEDEPRHASLAEWIGSRPPGGTFHLRRRRPVEAEDRETRLMKWLERQPPNEIRDAALDLLRDERCRAEIRQRREWKETLESLPPYIPRDPDAGTKH